MLNLRGMAFLYFSLIIFLSLVKYYLCLSTKGFSFIQKIIKMLNFFLKHFFIQYNCEGFYTFIYNLQFNSGSIRINTENLSKIKTNLVS